MADGDPPSDQSQPDRIRTVAQWLAASFGAVGAVLIASLKLSDISKLTSTGHTLALLGFGLGMLGVILAIGSMAWVITPRTTTLATISDLGLTKRAEAEDWLSGYDSVEVLTEYYRGAASLSVTSYEAMISAASLGNQPEVDKAEVEHNRASSELDLANPAIDRLLGSAASWRLSRRWWQGFAIFIGGVAITCVGVAMFASQSPPSAAEPPAVAEAPERVVVNLTPSATRNYKERLGSQCDVDHIAATALDTTKGKTTLLVTDPRCEPVELVLTSKQAEITATTPAISIPSPHQPTTTQKSGH